jgi:hypothetical protein
VWLKGDFEMFKKRIIALITGLALLAAVAASSGIVADSLGLPVTPQVHACGASGGGGGC